MFPWWPSTKIVQAMVIHQKTWTQGAGLFSLFLYIANFKNLLVRNQWTDFSITWQEWFFGDHYKDCSSHHDLSKNMAARGRGFFSLYLYIENFKNILVRNHWTDFNITWQECVFGDQYQDYSSHHDTSKNMVAWRWDLFSLYIYIENFKNLLIRNQCTDFNKTWQKCFFGNPLPRVFKLLWFIKKNMAARGQGLFSLYIYIENFKNLLVRNHWTGFNILWWPSTKIIQAIMICQKSMATKGVEFIFPIYLYRKL